MLMPSHVYKWDLEAEAQVRTHQREPDKCLEGEIEEGAEAVTGSLQDAAQDDKVAGNELEENGIGWQVGEKRQRRLADGNQEVEGVVYSLDGALGTGTFPDLELNNSRGEAFGLWVAGETMEDADLACGGLGLDDQDIDIASV